MKREQLADGLLARFDARRLCLGGELTQANGALLEQWMSHLPPLGVLALGDLEIEDGVACTHALNAVRLMRGRVERLQLEQAPQALAHNLYRSGMLLDGTIELKDMREDEAYG